MTREDILSALMPEIERIVDAFIANRCKPPTPLDHLATVVSVVTGVSKYDLRRPTRRRPICYARHIFYREGVRQGFTALKLAAYASSDHSTVVTCSKTIENVARCDREVSEWMIRVSELMDAI